MVKIFGDVPLFTNSRLTAVDSGTLQRSSASDVYAQIETDLNVAIAALPAEKSVNGRATSFTAHALLGKVYLYQDKFDQAAVIWIHLLVLTDCLKDLEVYFKSGENGAESVYEIQHTKDSNWWAWDYVPKEPKVTSR